jgi:hypothetical protein
MKEEKKYYIAKCTNLAIPKPFYVGLGLLTKKEVDKKEKESISEIKLEICEDKPDYDKKLNEYRKLGFCLF